MDNDLQASGTHGWVMNSPVHSPRAKERKEGGHDTGPPEAIISGQLFTNLSKQLNCVCLLRLPQLPWLPVHTVCLVAMNLGTTPLTCAKVQWKHPRQGV